MFASPHCQQNFPQLNPEEEERGFSCSSEAFACSQLSGFVAFNCLLKCTQSDPQGGSHTEVCGPDLSGLFNRLSQQMLDLVVYRIWMVLVSGQGRVIGFPDSKMSRVTLDEPSDPFQ